MSHGRAVAIVHHHLRPGGVTRVIQNAVDALRARGVRVAVLSGEAPPPGNRWPCPVGVVAGWGYDAQGRVDDAPAYVGRLRDVAQHQLGVAPDVWHIHNHSLGKNPAVTSAVGALARAGEALVLQLHDFAEDGRPSLYKGLVEAFDGAMDRLYPLGPRVRYALLNARDRTILLGAGCEQDAAVVLPNPVPVSQIGKMEAVKSDTWIYPTRAIRRKNLGEWLLWSLMAEPGARFQVTLAPKNPEHRPIYDAWVEWAVANELPVEFEVGAKGEDFATLLRRSRAAGTVSVGEGFGLAFLEPYALGVAVTGRNLPEITADFTEAGVCLDHLYDALRVPVDWIHVDAFRSRLHDVTRAAWQAYGQPLPSDAVERAWKSMVSPEGIDFGRLDEPEQRHVMERLIRSPANREKLTPSALPQADDAARIEANREAIRTHFNLETYADRLLALYASVQDEQAGGDVGTLDAPAILRAFLSPERFNILRA